MALSNDLAEEGYNPKSVDASVRVTFEVTDYGPSITGIELQVNANIHNIDDATYQEFAEGAKKGCPVSKALAGTEITLEASLV